MTGEPLDYVTILTSKGPLATKRITAVPGGPPKIEGYSKAKHFSVEEVPVSGFPEMAAVLATLVNRPRSLLIRGQPIEGVDRNNMLRRVRARGNEPATLKAKARHWFAVEFDSVPCPSGIDRLHEPDRVVEHVIELLPPEFQGASCWWTFTSGHGIKPGIRIRLWFWLDRPVEDWEFKTWLAGAPVDLSLYSPAQAIYVAKPVFIGMADPVPFRFGTWCGYGDVTPPVIERPQPRAAASDGSADGGGGYAYHRSRIGDHEGGGGFYGPIRAALGMFFRNNGAEADCGWVRGDLENAIRSAHRDPLLHDDGYIEHRIVDLDPWIEWVREREAEKKVEAEQPIDPTHPAPMGSILEARAVLADTMREIVQQVREYRAAVEVAQDKSVLPRLDLNDEAPPTPPAWGINVDVALGKTTAFREIVAAELVRDGLPVALAAPEHKLNNEIARDLVEAGISAHVYRGREQPDPDAPGERMCREWERAAEIFHAMGDVEKHACGKPNSEHVCEFYSVCGSRRQRAATPQVWLVPHASLFHPKPKFIPSPAVLGIDEKFHDYGVEGTDKPKWLELSALTGDRTVPGPGVFSSADLAEISRRTHSVLAAHGDGPLRREALIKAGLTADDLRNAQKLEWRRKLDLDDIVKPGMPRGAAISACKKIAKHNGLVVKLARLWDLLARQVEGGQECSPWLSVDSIADEVRMAWRKDIHESWSAPTVVMDATLQPEIVRQFFPQMTGPVRVSAPMPHTYVRQITDRAMSKAMLIPTEAASERRNQARENNLERLRRLIEARANDIAPGCGIVICQEKVELALNAGSLPDNIEVVHFNAIRGLNRWSDIALVMVVGRTEPSPRDSERIAGVLFGAEIESVPADDKGNVRYPKVTRGIRMRDGTGRRVEGNQHPDGRVEAVRWSICESELVQAIGRGRGVNRGPDNPLQVDIITNVCLPIEVDETTTWDAIQPSPWDVMRARGAIPLGYADQARTYPDLFSSAKAAELAAAAQRKKPPLNVYENLLIDKLGGFLALPYRRGGTRGPPGRLLYDPARIDPGVWLAERLGDVTVLRDAPATAAAPASVAATEDCDVAPVAAVPAAPALASIGRIRACDWFVLGEGGRLRPCGCPTRPGRDRCDEHLRRNLGLFMTALGAWNRSNFFPPFDGPSNDAGVLPPRRRRPCVARFAG